MSLHEEVRPEEVRSDDAAPVRSSRLHAVPERVETDAPVMMVTTQGGHLAHLVALESWWRRYDRIWVAPHRPPT